MIVVGYSAELPHEVVQAAIPLDNMNQSRPPPTLREAQNMAKPSSAWPAPSNLEVPSEKFRSWTSRNCVAAMSCTYLGRFTEQWDREPSWKLRDGKGERGLTFHKRKAISGCYGRVTFEGGRGGDGAPGENAREPHPGRRGSTFFTTLRSDGDNIITHVTETTSDGAEKVVRDVTRLDDAEFGLDFRAPGGEGGDGGRGGDGGDGGKGADGSNAGGTWMVSRGGRGGNGGQPGFGTSGADGGAGGDLIFKVSKGHGEHLLMVVKDLDEPTKINLVGGRGGKPGKHGKLGKPGKGGLGGIGRYDKLMNFRFLRLHGGNGEAKLQTPLPELQCGHPGSRGRVCVCVENEAAGTLQYWPSRYAVRIVSCRIRPADPTAGDELFFGSSFEVCDFKLVCGGGMPAPPLLGIHVEEVEHATGIERDVVSYYEGFLPGHTVTVNAPATGGRVLYPPYARKLRTNFEDEAVECELDAKFGITVSPDRDAKVKVDCRALVVGGPRGYDRWDKVHYRFVRPFLEGDVLRASVNCGYPIKLHLPRGATSLAPGESSILHVTIENLSKRMLKRPLQLQIWLADAATSDVKRWAAVVDPSFEEPNNLFEGKTIKPTKRTGTADFSLAYPGWIGTLENIKECAKVDVKLRYGLKRSDKDLAYTCADLRVSLWIYDYFDLGWHLAERCSLKIVCEPPPQQIAAFAPCGDGVGSVDKMSDQHDVVLLCSTSTPRKAYETWVHYLQDNCGLSLATYPVTRFAQFSSCRSAVFMLDKPFNFNSPLTEKARLSQALTSTHLLLASDEAAEARRVAAFVVVEDHDDDDPPAVNLRRLLRMPRSNDTIDVHLSQSGKEAVDESYLSEYLKGKPEPTEEGDFFHGAEDLIDEYFDHAMKFGTQQIHPLRLEVYHWPFPGASFAFGDERKMSVWRIQRIFERAAQKLHRKLTARHPTVGATIVYKSETRNHPVNTQSTADLKRNKSQRAVQKVRRGRSRQSKATPERESSKWGWLKHRTLTPWRVGYLLVYLRPEGATSGPRIHRIKSSANDPPSRIALAAATALTRQLKFKGLSNILQRKLPSHGGSETLSRALLSDITFEFARLVAASPPGLRSLRKEDVASLTERHLPTVHALLTPEKSIAAGAPCGLVALTRTEAAAIIVKGMTAMAKIPNCSSWDPTQKVTASRVLARAQKLVEQVALKLKARWQIEVSDDHDSDVSRRLRDISEALQTRAKSPHPAFIDAPHLRSYTCASLHALIHVFTPWTCLLSASHLHPIDIISGYEHLEDCRETTRNLVRARDAFAHVSSSRSDLVLTAAGC